MAGTRENNTRQGVDDAWGFWLSQHPISVPEMIMEAVEKAFYRWCDDNETKVLAAIARRKTPLEDDD
jgi:hypothetical protein